MKVIDIFKKLKIVIENDRIKAFPSYSNEIIFSDEIFDLSENIKNHKFSKDISIFLGQSWSVGNGVKDVFFRNDDCTFEEALIGSFWQYPWCIPEFLIISYLKEQRCVTVIYQLSKEQKKLLLKNEQCIAHKPRYE